MPKQTRRKSTGLGEKNSRPPRKASAKMTAAGKNTTAAAKTKRAARKPRPASVGDRLSNAYRTVVDTVSGTGRLRDKLEPPGTSETE